MKGKRCGKCKRLKSLNEFRRNKNGKHGRRSQCKVCEDKKLKQCRIDNKDKIQEYNTEYRKTNRKKIKKLRDQYYENNREIVLEKRRERYKDNMEREKANNIRFAQNNPNYKKEYYVENKEHLRKIGNLYYQNNKQKISKRRKKYFQNNASARISSNLRRINTAIRGKRKSGSAIKDLGCTVRELKKYLEAQFYKNTETGEMMTWDNYGLYGWHIDHIQPLASFDLVDREQFKRSCHYTNLQPLWAKENLSKGDRDGNV